jgi:hypothetical protein
VLHGCNVAPCLGHSVEAAARIATDQVYVETNYCSALALFTAFIDVLYLKQQEITAALK